MQDTLYQNIPWIVFYFYFTFFYEKLTTQKFHQPTPIRALKGTSQLWKKNQTSKSFLNLCLKTMPAVIEPDLFVRYLWLRYMHRGSQSNMCLPIFFFFFSQGCQVKTIINIRHAWNFTYMPFLFLKILTSHFYWWPNKKKSTLCVSSFLFDVF